jgi:hypothetical protein
MIARRNLLLAFSTGIAFALSIGIAFAPVEVTAAEPSATSLPTKTKMEREIRSTPTQR